MSRMTIYLEGGGDTAGQKNKLRLGMDTFLASLKDEARARRWGWKLVPCGGRQNAYETFKNARVHAKDGETIVLLVDSEAAVSTATSSEYLRTRLGDRWELADVPEDHIHLMVQTMETWVVADPDTLERYYGQHFYRNALPRTDDLESVNKVAVAESLRLATRRTSKGEYHKILHASELLQLIDATTVRQRCGHCERLFRELGRVVAEG